MIVGCDEASEPANPSPVVTPTAEERFESIVKALRRQVEDASLTAGTGATAPPGTPVASGRVRVESELQPGVEGAPRRAKISLITTSKVTVILPRNQSAGDDTSDSSSGKSEPSDALQGVSGLPDLDALRAPGRGSDSGELGGGALHEIKNDESRRVYDLEYRDGKWVLLTEPDEENEPFYALALEYALKKQ